MRNVYPYMFRSLYKAILVALMLHLPIGLEANVEPQPVFLAKWGSYGIATGQFRHPWGVAVNSTGHVYVVDTYNHRIQKFDRDGHFLATWGSEGTGDGQFNAPMGVSVDSWDNVYVADTSNNRIQKFDSEGHFLIKWGSYGTREGQFAYPTCVAVDSSNSVYVIEILNHRIQKFDSERHFLATWGSVGRGDSQFYNPSGATIDSTDNLYVVDTGNCRIQKFDGEGRFLTKWGFLGSSDGMFYNPSGAAIDTVDNLYVVDRQNNRIQKFGSGRTRVEIDIQPGANPNSINLKSKGRIPVAILTTSHLDAATVDPKTVFFGANGTEAGQVHFALEDVDKDGDTDMILHFKIQDTRIKCGDTEASLTGTTLGEESIKGSDSINTVACQ